MGFSYMYKCAHAGIYSSERGQLSSPCPKPCLPRPSPNTKPKEVKNPKSTRLKCFPKKVFNLFFRAYGVKIRHFYSQNFFELTQGLKISVKCYPGLIPLLFFHVSPTKCPEGLSLRFGVPQTLSKKVMEMIFFIFSSLWQPQMTSKIFKLWKSKIPISRAFQNGHLHIGQKMRFLEPPELLTQIYQNYNHNNRRLYCLSDRELYKTIVHWYKIINLFQYVSFSFVLLIQ